MTSALRRNNVRVVGDAAQTLVLSHGFGTDQTAWRSQIAAFAPHYRLVLFDHVGAGGSELSAYSGQRYRSLYSYAADLLEVLAELGAQQVLYVGHSMGAMIGLLAALQEPEVFARLIFIGGSPRYLNCPGYQGGFEQPDLDALYEAMAANYQAWVSGFAPLAMDNPEQTSLSVEFARTLAALRPDISLAMARLIFQSDHRAQLPQLRHPTLVIQSQRDIAVPVAVGEYMARSLPRGQLAIVEARGHFPHMSAPAAVNAAIQSFLT